MGRKPKRKGSNPYWDTGREIAEEIFALLHHTYQLFVDNNVWEDGQLGFVTHQIASMFRSSEFTADTCCAECYLHLNFEGKYKFDRLCCTSCENCNYCIKRDGYEKGV